MRPPAGRRSWRTSDGPDAAGELRRRGVVRRADLVAMGVPRSAVDAVQAPGAGGCLLDPGRATALGARLAAAVAAHDAADPLDPGLPLEAARRALELPDARLVEVVLRHGSDATAPGPTAALVLRDGRVAALAGAGLPPAVRAALDALRADLQQRPFDAPEAARLAELGLGSRQLASLVRAGELLRIADGVVLLPGADDRAVEVLAGLGAEFTLSAARQALGTSRRVAVPLLELLARTGRTERTADGGHRLTRP